MKPHRFDPLSFVAGAAFLALGLAFLVAGADAVEESRWLWPVLLLGLGAAVEQELLGKRGLAGVRVADDGEGAAARDLGGRVAAGSGVHMGAVYTASDDPCRVCSVGTRSASSRA